MNWLAATCSQPLNDLPLPCVLLVARVSAFSSSLLSAVCICLITGIIIKGEDFVGSDYAVGINNAAGIKYLVDGMTPIQALGDITTRCATTCVLVREAYNPHHQLRRPAAPCTF